MEAQRQRRRKRRRRREGSPLTVVTTTSPLTCGASAREAPHGGLEAEEGEEVEADAASSSSLFFARI
jgi:hypothetical protein